MKRLMTMNMSADVHIYDMKDEGLSVKHWNEGGEDRYTVKISGVTFFMDGDDYREEFAPRMAECLNNLVTI
jgi:hypothetical protein